MKTALLIFLSLSFSGLLANESFSFNHPTCIVRVHKISDTNFEAQLYSELRKKGFNPKSFSPRSKNMNANNMHMTATKALVSKKAFKDCEVEVEIKRAKNNYARSSDKTIYKKKSKRSFPRVTFKGNERCVRALRDAFIHIPYCKN